MISHPNRGTITKAIVTKLLKIVDAGLVKGVGNAKPGKMCIEAAVCYALGEPHGDRPSCVAPVLRELKIRLNDSNWSSEEARAKGLRRLGVAQLGSAGALDEKEFRRRVFDYALRSSVPAALRSAATIQKGHKHKAALLDAAARCEKEGTREAALQAKNAAAAAAYAAAADAAAAAHFAAAAHAAAAHAAANAAYAAAAAAAAHAAAAYVAANAAYAAAAAAAAYAAAAAANAAYAAAAYVAAHAAAAYVAAARKAARDTSLAAYAEAVVQILVSMDAPGCKWLELTEAA
jgi:hypothetical protein